MEESGKARAYACIACGEPMDERGCKIRCLACGYFEDCGGGLTPPPLTGPARPESATRSTTRRSR